MYKFLDIAADPEVFLMSQDNKMISSEGKIEKNGLRGTKKKPLCLEGYPQGFSFQEDNVSAEFCIPPASCKESFVDNIKTGLKILKKEFIQNHNAKICIKPSAIFSLEDLSTEQASMAGCESDNNVWERCVNPPIKLDRKYRFNGGHVHVGHSDPENYTLTENLIKCMDLFLGVPSIFIDKDIIRRKYYGKAGAFRFKPYGFEYRVLSNFWLKNTKFMEWVYDNTNLALAFDFNKNKINEYSQYIISAINNCDTYRAQVLIEKFNIPVPVKIEK